MIDMVDHMSLVLWGVFALAAGMYPLGFMLGGSCSGCCSNCEPFFHRCLRYLTVSGSVPPFSSTTLFLADAGIVKASSTIAQVIPFVIPPKAMLSAGEHVEWEVPVKVHFWHRNSDLTSTFQECEGIEPKTITIRVEGRDVPLTFNDAVFANSYAGGVYRYRQPASAGGGGPRVASFEIESAGEHPVNTTATLSAVVVGAMVNDSTHFQGGELTDASLRSMLTVGTPMDAPASWDASQRVKRVTLSVSIPGGLFRYVPEATEIGLTWLVKVNRGTAETFFYVTAAVPIPFASDTSWRTYTAPATGELTAVVLSPMPDHSDTSALQVLPVVVNELSAVVQAIPSITQYVSIPVEFYLSGECTLGSVRGVRVVADVPDSPSSGAMGAGGSILDAGSIENIAQIPPSFPMDSFVFVTQETYETLGTQPLIFRKGLVGANYDFDEVQEYRDGDRGMRVSRTYTTTGVRDVVTGVLPSIVTTDEYDVWIEAASPMCGMSMCDLPQDLLPQGITYTPAAGVKFDCEDATGMVLGNPEGGCEYSHSTNTCRGSGSVAIDLRTFFTDFQPVLPFSGDGRTGQGYTQVDALTWLAFEPEAVEVDSIPHDSGSSLGLMPDNRGSYAIGGTYSPSALREGRCYASNTPNRTFAAVVGGTCPAAEVTLTVGEISYVDSGGLHNTRGAESVEVIGAVTEMSGDYILKPAGSSWPCNGSHYAFGGVPFLGITTPGISALYMTSQTTCAPPQRKTVSINVSAPHSTGAAPGSGVPTYRWWNGTCTAYSPPDNFDGANTFAQSSFYLSGAISGDGEGTGGAVIGDFHTSFSIADGPAMTKCSGVTFSPTEFTTDGTPGHSLILPGGVAGAKAHLVQPAGEYVKCGVRIEGPRNGNLIPSENKTDQDRLVYRWAVSDGSPAEKITIRATGGCRAVTIEQRTPARLGGGCVTVAVIPSGDSCAWSATCTGDGVGFVNQTTEAEPVTGAGYGECGVTVPAAPQGSSGGMAGSVTVTLDDGATATLSIMYSRFQDS